jgi:hypothetical protein
MIDKPEARRFPPPWIAEETDACFIIRDHSGYALAYVYFEDEPGRRSSAHLLTRDEARRIAANIAKLPELLRQISAEQSDQTQMPTDPAATPEGPNEGPLND